MFVIVRAIKDIDAHVANLFIMKEELLTVPATAEFERVLSDEGMYESFENLAPAQLLAFNVLLMKALRKKLIIAMNGGNDGD